jgi:hypothetical protein
MKNITKILFSVMTLMILSVSLASSTCSVNLDKDIYSSSETVTVNMDCSGGQGEEYKLNWINSLGELLEQDIGTLPKKDTYFYETYNLPSDYSGTINVVLYKYINGIIGSDSANVIKVVKQTEDKKVEPKHKGSSCVTQWIWDSSVNDWVKEDWVHPAIKKIIKEKGIDSSEYKKWKNHWKTIPGKHCVAVGDNGRKISKPDYIPEKVLE